MATNPAAFGTDSDGGRGKPYVPRFSYGATGVMDNAPEVIEVSGTVTKACFTTPVTVLTAAQVGAGRKIVDVRGFLSVDGATAWSVGGTYVTLKDTASTPVEWARLAVAGLSANVMQAIGGTNWTAQAGVKAGALTEGKGLVIAGDADFTNGSDIKYHLFVTVRD